MKKILLIITIILIGGNVFAQDKLYLLFEFMKVDEEQEIVYDKTETFWEKLHEQRIKNGDIIGWDLWRLQPGGEDQGYQYLTVTLFTDPVKMFNGGDIQAALNAAYPDMSQDELNKNFDYTSKTRDLSVRLYLEQIDVTKDEFEMPLGTIAAINMMKTTTGNYSKYENMESTIFKPMHQKEVDNGSRENWGLMRIMLPRGSEVFASHITVDMYKDYNQFFMPPQSNTETVTAEQQKAISEALETRDLTWTYMATLIKKAR
jgi:hypothetical protein